LADLDFIAGTTPLVFVRLLGFTTSDAIRLMQAAQRMNDTVRWRLAPAGVQTDVYLAHASSVQRGKPPTPSSNSVSGQSLGGVSGFTQLYIDENGWHKTHPVCVLGSSAPTPSDETPAAMVFPQALQELKTGLARLEQELIGLRMMYTLGRLAWEQRATWKTHRLHLTHRSRLIAVIEPHHWHIHLLDECRATDLENATVMPVPQSSGFAAAGFDVLKLETALWELAKRCPEELLAHIVPTAYLQDPLAHRRMTELSARDLGDACVAILHSLDTRSSTAEDLQKTLRLSRPALLRAIAGLALIRAIHTEPSQSGWFRWLPFRLRKKLWGRSPRF
jgi:hypothetical protein